MAAHGSKLVCSPRKRQASASCELASAQIDEVVAELNTVCRASSLEFALRIGAIVVHHFYDGDTNAWRDRGRKETSFRRLAEHPDLPISAGALYRSVAIFEICDRLRAASRWRRLGASHLRAVIGIPPERQEPLLVMANQERWSVQHLRSKAQELKVGPSRGGRRQQSTLGKNLRKLEQYVRECEDRLGRVASHEALELKENLDVLTKLKASVDRLTQALEDRLSGSPS